MTTLATPRTSEMRNLLGWLETRLAQITFDDLKIASRVSIAQGSLSYVKVV